MSLQHSPSIVTNGLVFYVDAANQKSYSGSGNTWFDLSTSKNNGTLVNSPTYSSSNNGTIIFNGSNTYINVALVTSSANNVCLSAWFNSYNVNQAGQGIIHNGSDAAGTGYGFFINNESTTSGTIKILYSGVVWIETSFQTVSNTWYQGTMNILSDGSNQFYINGKLVFTGTSNVIHAPTLYTNIGRNDYAAARYFNGNISNAMIYNRVLSSSEIQQNFNALRGRYGI